MKRLRKDDNGDNKKAAACKRKQEVDKFHTNSKQLRNKLKYDNITLLMKMHELNGYHLKNKLKNANSTLLLKLHGLNGYHLNIVPPDAPKINLNTVKGEHSKHLKNVL